MQLPDTCYHSLTEFTFFWLFHSSLRDDVKSNCTVESCPTVKICGTYYDLLHIILENAVICEPGNTRSHLDAFSKAVPKAHTGHLVDCSTDTTLPQSPHLECQKCSSFTSIYFMDCFQCVHQRGQCKKQGNGDFTPVDYVVLVAPVNCSD